MQVSRMLSVQMLIPYTVKHSSISKIQPVVLIVPPISDRYYTFEFLDAYTNVYAYIEHVRQDLQVVLTL